MTNELIPIKRTRRAYSAAFKAEMVRASRQPNVSVAGLALANGLNANLLRRWVRQHEGDGDSEPLELPAIVAAPSFISVPMSTAQQRTCQLHLVSKNVSATLTVPLDALDQCAGLLQLLLR